MISTYTPLPLPPSSAPAEDAPPAVLDASRDVDTPSFQARLDQQNDLYRSNGSSSATKSPDTATRRDDADEDTPASEDASAAHDTPAGSSASSKDGVAATRRDDAKNVDEDDTRTKKARALHRETQNAAPAAPFTTATLALTGGIAPLPAAAPVSGVPVSADQGVLSIPMKAALVPATAQPVPATAQIVAPTASAVLPTPAPVTPAVASLPLNLPGVPMDPGAVGKTAAPGVANASLSTFAPIPAAPTGLPLPAIAALPGAAIPALPAPVSAVKTDAAVSAAQPADPNAEPSNAAPPSPAVPIPGAAPAVPPANIVPTTTANNSVAPPAADSLPVAVPVIASLPMAAPVKLPDLAVRAVVLPAVAPPDVKIAAPQNSAATVRTVAAGAGASIDLAAAPLTLPGRAAFAADATAGSAPVGQASKEQNLDGIKRLLTLGPGSSANNPAAGGGQAAGAGLPVVSAQPSANITTAAAPRSVPALPAPGANAGASLSLAPLPNAPNTNALSAVALDATAPDALAASAIALSASADAGAAASLALPASGAVARMAEMMQAGGKNGALGPAPLLTGEVTAPGSTATGSLIALQGAQSQSSATDDREEQAHSGAQNQAGDGGAGDTSGSGLSGVAGVPASGGQTAPTAGASAAVAGLDSQIDRAQVVAQVTRHLEEMRLANGNGEMRLHLTPGHLGHVQISVASHQAGVVARIAVETAQIQQAMEGAKAHLRATLEARGLHVQSVEVTVTSSLAQNGQSAFGQQRSQQSDGEGLSERAAYTRGASAASAASALPAARDAALPRAANSRLDCQA